MHLVVCDRDMKHVFFIHSHTVFLTALGTIDYQSINIRDVIFLYARNYQNKYIHPQCTIVDISEMYKSFQCGRNLLYKQRFRRKKIKECDDFIDKIIGEEFVLYVPHFAFSLFQIFYTNSNCKKAYYLQEGGVQFVNAYKTDFSLPYKILFWLVNHLLLTDKRMMVPRKWYIKGFLSKQKTVEAFSISKDFFKYLPAVVHIIEWPKIKMGLTILPKSPIFIFDGFVGNHHIEGDFYYSKCKLLVSQEAKNVNYIKFHPMQSKEERLLIQSFFPKNANINIIEDQIPMELILSNYKDLLVVGFESSLLVFAKDFGHDVHAYGDWLRESEKFSNYIKKSY